MSQAPDKRALVKLGPDGIYFTRPYLGTDKVTKRPIRPYRRFPEAADEAQAQAMADEWFAEMQGMEWSMASALWHWLSDYAVRESAPSSTIATYESAIRCYIEPVIGDLYPRDVMPGTIDGLYTYLMLHGASRHGGGIDAATVSKVHWVLCGAFRWMAVKGIVDMSPMASVERPRPPKREALFLLESQFARISEALQEALSVPDLTPKAIFERNAAMATETCFSCGTRCGEACAVLRGRMELFRKNLRVDATAREVRREGVVRAKTTKTRKPRNVSLYDGYIEQVREHYAWQAGYLEPRAGCEEELPLCCDAEGRMLRPSRVTSWFKGFRERAGLPKGITPHTLRHSHATWLLMGGEDLKTIMERLGDSSEAMFLGTYLHVMPGRDAEAAERFGAIRRELAVRP